MAADPLDVPAASAAVSQPAAGVAIHPAVRWTGRLLWTAVALMPLVSLTGVWMGFQPAPVPQMITVIARAPGGAIVTATGSSGNQNPLAPLNGISWSSGQAPGASWEVRFRTARPRVVTVRSSTFGALQIESSEDGVVWKLAGSYKVKFEQDVPVVRFARANMKGWRVRNVEGLNNITLQGVAFK